MAVKVQFEIGHTARLRSKKTSEGFTHDWELYVRGVKEADISTYVDKVVFNLHDSFPKPKRVCNKPPYVITESGYAGFLLPIDIYFRNRDEPKRIQFTYDLDLQQTGPPHHRFEVQKFVFDHVSDEFRQKLLKGGGIPVTGAGMVGGATVSSTNNTPNAAISDEGGGMVSKPKLSSGESIGGSSGKKHKTRIDDSKSNSFANLFGAPIKSGSSKHSPDGKNNSLNTVGGKGAPSTSNASGSGAGTGGGVTPNSGNINSNNSIAKEKSSKDREKTNSSTLASSSNEKSREKSDKKEKHKSSSSPNKESRSENKKSSGDSSKHEKREESKSKKDKSRDKERERSREKGSSGGTKRSLSPKSNVRDAGAPSPKRPTPPRSSSSASGRVEDIKSAGSSSKIEGKESKSREEKSTSSGKKSKKEKKDKDKDKERDKERRDEHKEKHRSGDGKSRDPKEERHGNIINSSSNTVTTATSGTSGNIITNEAKDNKGQQSPANFSIKKPDKDAKEKTEAVKGKNNDKNIDKISTNPTTTQVGGTNATTTTGDKKLPTSSNNQSEKLEKEKDKDKEKDKEKRSHKHKKKDKNKDKDKEREKERDKERHKEREKEKEKERDKERSEEKLRSEKHTETNSNGNASSMGAASTATSGSKAASLPIETTAPQNEPPKPEPNSVISLSNSTSNSTNSNNLNNNANSSAPIAPIKKSQNRDRKNKDKSSKEEKRNSGELGELESRSSSKHSNKSAGTIIPANTNTTVTVSNTTGNNSSKTIDASDTGKVPLPEDAALLTPTSATNPAAVTSTDIAPVVMHSDSSNSSFPDLTPKPSAPSKVISLSTKSETTPTEKPDKTTSIITKEHKQRSGERNAKTKDINDKTEKADKKVEKEEKKRRRSSVAASTVSANSFLEPPLKQAKKESIKTAREQTKSPALRQSRAASISGPIGINNGNDNGSNSSNATTQNNNSNTTDALNSGGAFLPPPNNTTGTSVTSSPSTLAITSNANANLNANSIVSASTTGAAAAASLAPPHPLRPASPVGPVGAMAAEAAGANNGSTPTPALPTEYLSELQELHHKIMTLQDNEELQQVVEMIAATGCYEITAKTFDFDLCKLDRSTVQRLQEFFATSVS